MKSIFFIIVLLIISSCKKQKPHKKTISSIGDYYSNNCLAPQSFSINTHDIQSIEFKKWLSFTFFEEVVKAKDILKIQKSTTFCLIDYGEVEIYRLSLSEDLPANTGKVYHFLFAPQKQEITLFPFESYQIFQIKPEDSCFLFGGTRIFREGGYFEIYQFDGKCFHSIFNSSQYSFCNQSIKTHRNLTDCHSYSPPNLVFKNRDINQDGILDMTFTGELLFFCEGLEQGYNKEDRSPIKKMSIDFQFITSLEGNSLRWKVMNTIDCNDFTF